VTNKCTHLISAETGTKKCADAEKKGVVVVDEAWVRDQCGGSTMMEEEEEAPPAPKKGAKKAKKEVVVEAVSGGDSGDGPLAGLTFCMTGTMSVPRAEMEGFITANGGEVAKTVTNKCTHLISAETGTKKCADAEKKGVVVVDEAWVRDQCGGSTMMEVEEEEEAPPAPAAKKGAKAKPTASSKASSGGDREFVYMECDSSSGGKFWQCTLDGSGTTVVYGKVGSAGATQVKDHGSADAAKKFFDKVGREKANKGYIPVTSEVKVAEKPPPKPKTTAPPKATKAKKATTAAASSGCDSVHLECASSSGGKFWECSLDGEGNTTVTYGKLGTAGATQVKNHGSEEAARKFFDKVLKEKQKKGYS